MDDQLSTDEVERMTIAQFIDAVRRGKVHPDARSKNGRTQLMQAAIYNEPDEISALFKLGAGLDLLAVGSAQMWTHGKTALMMAAHYSRVESVRVLCELGASLDVQDETGMTVLMWAVVSHQVECIRVLCERGASLDVQDRLGMTALRWVVLRDHVEAVHVLCAHGAHPPSPEWCRHSTLEIKALIVAQRHKLSLLALMSARLVPRLGTKSALRQVRLDIGLFRKLKETLC